jgi:hypothetical protein
MKKIAIVCGGYDDERILSFYSADNAEQALQNGSKRILNYRIVLSNDAFSFRYETPKGSYPMDRTCCETRSAFCGVRELKVEKATQKTAMSLSLRKKRYEFYDFS